MPSNAYNPVAPATVLVVDDELLLAEETAIGLELAGIAAMTAASATEAMALLREHKNLRVMVTDIRMPQEDGISLARRALAEQGANGFAVIFMAGHATDTAMTEMAGVAGFLRKPFPVEELADLVRAAMAAQPAVPQPRVR